MKYNYEVGDRVHYLDEKFEIDNPFREGVGTVTKVNEHGCTVDIGRSYEGFSREFYYNDELSPIRNSVIEKRLDDLEKRIDKLEDNSKPKTKLTPLKDVQLGDVVLYNGEESRVTIVSAYIQWDGKVINRVRLENKVNITDDPVEVIK